MHGFVSDKRQKKKESKRENKKKMHNFPDIDNRLQCNLEYDYDLKIILNSRSPKAIQDPKAFHY